MRLYIRNKSGDDEVDEDIVMHHHIHHVHHHQGESDKSLAAKHPTAVEVLERLEDHPHTWVGHMGTREGGIHIVKMEMNELIDAIALNSEEQVCKELCDLAAACIHALKMK